MFDIFYKSGTAELTSSLDIAGDEVFYFSEMSPMHKVKSIREQEKDSVKQEERIYGNVVLHQRRN